METDEDVTGLIERVRTLKTSVISKDIYPGDFIPLSITAYREGSPYPFALSIADTEEDVLMQVVAMFIIGLGADKVVAVAEGFSAMTQENPDTGMPWEDKDMEFMWETDFERAQQFISHAIQVHYFDRSRSDWCYASLLLPYSIEDGQITWSDPKMITSTIDSDSDAAEMMRESTLYQDVLKEINSDNVEIGGIPAKEVFKTYETKYGFELIVQTIVISMVKGVEGVVHASLLFEAGSDKADKVDAILNDPAMRSMARDLGEDITGAIVNTGTFQVNEDDLTIIRERA